MNSRIFPAFGVCKSLFILEYKALLNRMNKTAINIAVIMATENIAPLLSCINLQPNKTANRATDTKPIYPLSLSKSTVATTSRVFLVWAAKSMLRTRSPPMVEGRKRLKNIPPAFEIITLFKGRWILAALSNISQRKRHKKRLKEKIKNAISKSGLSAFFIISARFFLSTSLNKKISRIILTLILNIIEAIFLNIAIAHSLNSLPVNLL